MASRSPDEGGCWREPGGDPSRTWAIRPQPRCRPVVLAPHLLPRRATVVVPGHAGQVWPSRLLPCQNHLG